MKPIDLADAVIAWTPNTIVWRNRAHVAPAGSIRVFDGTGDSDGLDLYPAVRGSCDRDWREGDEACRLEIVADLMFDWVIRDEMDQGACIDALGRIDGYGPMAELRVVLDEIVEQRWFERDTASVALH